MTAILEDKVFVIIGGTSGLGLSATRACREAGARLVIVGRKAELVDAAEAESGDSVAGLRGDATDPATAEAAIDLAVERFGDFHGLYHVAGGSGRRRGDGPLHELSDEGWRWTIDLNLSSLAYSNRAAVRKLLELGHGGSILNMGSVLGSHPSPAHFSTHAYAAAKSAIVGLTRSAAAYYAKSDIRFNVIAPALTATPMAERALDDEEILSFVKSRQPLDGGRVGEPEDTDAAVVYLLSDQSRFVTGQVLAIDGGWSVSDGSSPTGCNE